MDTILHVHPAGATYADRVAVDGKVTAMPHTRRWEEAGPTSYMVRWRGRWRRVHHYMFTAYFMDRGVFMVVT